MIGTVFEVLTAQRTRWRRARNLRAGTRPQAAFAWRALRPHLRLSMPGPLARLGLASVLVAALGAWVIATHARWMAAAGGEGATVDSSLVALQAALPGAAFTVPLERGVRLEAHNGTILLILSGMAAEPFRHIDLCSQMADPARGKLLPLRIGYRFDEIAALAARGGTVLRNVVLSDRAMPHVEIAGQAAGGAPLALRWSGRQAHWIGDGGPALSGTGGQAGLLRQGWLLWGADGALRVLRRPSTACPQAGELVLQSWRLADAGGAGRALVMAFPAAGAPAAGEPLEAWLAPGDYRVPAAAPARLEDEQLFEQLRAHGLVRLGAGGLAELAPPDLAAWRSNGPTAWDRAVLDEEGRRLLRHLYGRADGDFVREQVRIFNSERRLLAWRIRAADLAGAGAGSWRAEAGGAPAPLAQDLPAAGSRLFARLPQGWAPWQRIGAWPAAGSGQGAARLHLALARPARAGDWIQLMLAGRVLGVQGARLASAPRPACGGRACQAPDQVQVLDLQLEAGAHELVLDAAPLGMDALAAPGDARYRHLVLRGGQLAWQAMPASGIGPAARPGAPGLVQVRLLDRKGAELWHDGAPSGAARAAGLAPLLGVRAEQASGVAGMLARLPGAGPHEARLTLDLGLQRAAQAALDCIGLRHGQWDGRHCSGAGAVPEGRQAGLVVLDTETGDILAAAGSGAGSVDGADWRELRDFDRVDPAASPLRLPAWQHDGGAQRSPGSTFKIVSSLGLELAAQGDPRLDALLDGQALAGINKLARERGFDFRTDAPSYPAGGRARITNFRDQGLDRRAQDGRLGLAQALTYSLNTWFAWLGELSDRSLFGLPAGGVPDLQPLQPGALDEVRPIVAMARKLGFGAPLRLDGGLLPADYPWSAWDALQATPAGIDPVHTRHELRQMAIGLRMQATPLQMALVAGAVGQGRTIRPRLLAELDGKPSAPTAGAPLGVRLDRIRAGMKGVVDAGTAAGAFRGEDLARVRRGLSGKTGTAPVGDGSLATVWFTGWLEPGSIPGQAHRLALAVFVSRSEGTGGGHAAPVAAAVLRHLAEQGEK
jgi:cell division protein FtsI/penicillin-binding protein 2